MKSIAVVLISAALLLGALVYGEDELSLDVLPKGRPFQLTFADPREIKMAVGFASDGHIDAAIGNYFSLLGVHPASGDWAAHFGIEGAGYFGLRQADSRFPLETADGLIGMYLEAKRGDWAVQFRYTHISAHLADGSEGTPIAYSRETAIARFAYIPNSLTEVYVGTSLITNSTPKVAPAGAQWGGYYFLPWNWESVVPFAAVDFKWKAETQINPSVNLELGFALNHPPESYRSFRVYYDYYTGEDPRGQYYDHAFTAHMVGIEMQI